ncbi:hypothetical protein MAL01_15225 [Leptospira noguchii]|uniref:hypothetical protein n=1 Tax=Leptospira noguchii TaxID=28182 RepID=UPI001FB5DA42|nr:hypothetical protein [Leptospira noguchii]UOG46870.1 hypothetical protein MAL01_15225 [Leptospira noguchii]
MSLKNSEGIEAKRTQHNAFLWVGVQGVVALSLLFAPIFLRRTHVRYQFRGE